MIINWVRLNITLNIMIDIERPSYLCREIKSNQSTSTSAYNQTLCGYEKTQL